jgi:recombination protein RecA
LKEGEETIGMRMRAKIVKNKVAPPFRVAEFDMLGSRGISLEGDVLDLAAANNILQKSGTWFTYGETRLGQGRERARTFLEENPKVMDELATKVREVYLAGGKISGGAAPKGGDSEE